MNPDALHEPLVRSSGFSRFEPPEGGTPSQIGIAGTRFMVPMRAKNGVQTLPGPKGRAGCPQPAGHRRAEDAAPYPSGRFMAAMRVRILQVAPFHNPQSRAGVSPAIRTCRPPVCNTTHSATMAYPTPGAASPGALLDVGCSMLDVFPLMGSGSGRLQRNVRFPSPEVLHEFRPDP